MSGADEKEFVALENYQRILEADAFHEATWNTLVWTLFSTFFAFVFGFGAALALNRAFAGRGLLRGVLLVPYVISAVAASCSAESFESSPARALAFCVFCVFSVVRRSAGTCSICINWSTTVFSFADSNAKGEGPHPHHLYTVAFAARELWGDDAPPADKVYLDLWGDYLEPA